MICKIFQISRSYQCLTYCLGLVLLVFLSFFPIVVWAVFAGPVVLSAVNLGQQHRPC